MGYQEGRKDNGKRKTMEHKRRETQNSCIRHTRETHEVGGDLEVSAFLQCPENHSVLLEAPSNAPYSEC